MKKYISLIIAVIFLDQLSKFWVKTTMYYSEAIKVFDWFYIRLVENPGMAWGFEFGGEAGKMALSIFRTILIIALIVYFSKLLKRNTSPILLWAWTFIIAGALGNLIDSVFYGLIFDRGLHFAGSGWVAYDGVANANFAGYAPIFQGCVVDMLSFPIIDTMMPDWVPILGGKPFTFFDPIFNLADSAISVGFVILVYIVFFKSEKNMEKEVYPSSTTE